MQNPYNDITINEQHDSTIITIQFKKSVYKSTIWMHYLIAFILLSVGLFSLVSSISNQNYDDIFMIMIWLFILLFLSYFTYGQILWLQKGKEIIILEHNQLVLKKIYPAHKLYNATSDKTIVIDYQDLVRVYYSRYIPFKNSFPSKSKGNLHFKDHQRTYHFAINLDQQECTPIIRLIKQKVPSIEINV